MKVINPAWRMVTCHGCLSLLEIDLSDVRVDGEVGHRPRIYVRCPVCKTEVTTAKVPLDQLKPGQWDA